MAVVNQLCEIFRQARIPCTVSLTAEAGDATVLAHAARDKYDLLAVVGGDGTVNEVLQSVTVGHPAILIVPAGTENVLAKYLGLTGSPRQLWEIVQDGWTVDFDLGRLGQRRFSMLASVGFDAAIVHALHAERSGNITHMHYFWPLWREFWQYDWPVLSVSADGAEVFRGRGMIVVGNISRYALGLQICRDAVPTDGLLDLFIMEAEDRWDLLRWATAVALRLHGRLKNSVSVRARQIRIAPVDGRPIPMEVDGDPAGMVPAEIDVVPAAASLLFRRSHQARLLPEHRDGDDE